MFIYSFSYFFFYPYIILCYASYVIFQLGNNKQCLGCLVIVCDKYWSCSPLLQIFYQSQGKTEFPASLTLVRDMWFALPIELGLWGGEIMCTALGWNPLRGSHFCRLPSSYQCHQQISRHWRLHQPGSRVRKAGVEPQLLTAEMYCE